MLMLDPVPSSGSLPAKEMWAMRADGETLRQDQRGDIRRAKERFSI